MVKNEPIVIQSATRVDLAGGTLDCWPLYLFLNDPVTVNVSIDVFTRARLTPKVHSATSEGDRSTVRLITRDLNLDRSYPSLDLCLEDSEPAFELIREVIRYFAREIGDRGFTLETESDSPVGGGLGGSSSLCISILKSFIKWTQKTFAETDLVRLASHVEARVLQKPTGTQDYFPPIQAGLCLITYGLEGPKCDRIDFDQKYFSDRFTLVYTGKSHHSGINNWQVIKDYLDGDTQTREAMFDLSKISRDVAATVRDGKLQKLTELFRREFEARVRLSSGFSSPEIEALSALAEKHRSVVKICGAGGGGCVFIWSPEGNRSEVIEAVGALARSRSSQTLRVLNAKPISVVPHDS